MYIHNHGDYSIVDSLRRSYYKRVELYNITISTREMGELIACHCDPSCFGRFRGKSIIVQDGCDMMPRESRKRRQQSHASKDGRG